MNIKKELKESLKQIEFKQLRPIFNYAIIPAIVFYALSFFILKESGFETMEVIRDTAQITNESSFLGFLSNIGIWLWVSSTAICFFTIFSREDLKRSHRELLLLSGGLSFFLAIDDFFMIHDRYVNQYICYLFYAVFALLLLLRHRATILKINPLSFLLMGFFLVSSIGTDVIQLYLPFEYGTTQIFEEGFKFLGAAIWLYFNFKVGSYREN